MKVYHLTAAVILTSFYFIDISAQTTSTGTTTTKSTDKVNKTLDNTNQGIDNATYTADKAKKVVGDLTKIFKPKTSNEALILIPGIEFEDENLAKLADAIKDHKSVKKSTIDYTDGTATISVVLKNKAGTDFWSDLPKEAKALFKIKNIQDNSIHVHYKNAVAETMAIPVATDNKTQKNNTPVRGAVTASKTETVTPSSKPEQTRRGAVQEQSKLSKQEESVKQPNKPQEQTRLTAQKKSVPGPESVFIQFLKDGAVQELMDVPSTIETNLQLLGTGIGITFFDVANGRMAIITLSDGGNELRTGKYSFPPNNGTKITAENASKTVHALFVYQASNSPSDNRSALASSIIISEASEANISSGFIEITSIDLAEKGIVEGKFQFTVSAWKNPQGKEIPGCRISEGVFRARIKK